MNFNFHLLGGIVAGGMTVSIAIFAEIAEPIEFNTLTSILNSESVDHNLITLFGLFSTSVFMSLFPDLDSASVLQRWFFRFVFLILLLLFFLGELGIFAAITFIALLPVLHRHRGWTHSKLTPFVLAIFFIVILEWYRSTHSWLGGFSFKNVGVLLKEYWIFVLACVVGHYTHLLLDWKS